MAENNVNLHLEKLRKEGRIGKQEHAKNLSLFV